MAKHPVPKKKMSNARTARRHAAFIFSARRKIMNTVNIVTCQACGVPALSHRACTKCGMYRGRSLRSVEKTIDKVTKVKA